MAEKYGGRPKTGLKKMYRSKRKLKSEVKKVNPKPTITAPIVIKTPLPKSKPLDVKPEGITIPPMQDFLSDIALIETQMRNPYLKKPVSDIGGNLFTNYLLWLLLSENMKLNRKIDKMKGGLI